MYIVQTAKGSKKKIKNVKMGNCVKSWGSGGVEVWRQGAWPFGTQPCSSLHPLQYMYIHIVYTVQVIYIYTNSLPINFLVQNIFFFGGGQT